MSKKNSLLVLCVLLLVTMMVFSCKTKSDVVESGDKPQNYRKLSRQIRIKGLEKIIQQLQKEIEFRDQEIADLLNQGKTDGSEIDNLKQSKDFLSSKINEIEKEFALLKKEAEKQRLKLKGLYDDLNKALEEELNNKSISLLEYEGIIIIRVQNSLLFDPESSVLKTENEQTLQKMALILNKIPEKIVRVEGHTAIRTDKQQKRSWELGADRAISIVRFLQNKASVAPERLVAVSFGEFRPIATNMTEEGKIKNRRVDIVLLDKPLYQINNLVQVK